MITGLARTRIGRVAAGNQILQPPDAPDEFCISMATISSRIEAPRTRGSGAAAIVPGSHQARWRFGPRPAIARPMPRLAPVIMAVLDEFINASLTRTGRAAAFRRQTGYRLLADGREETPWTSSSQ